MPKVDEDSARMALMELAEAFGADEGEVLGLLDLAMDGRLYLDGGKAVYRLAKPVELVNGDHLEVLTLRVATQQDYEEYAKGMKVVNTPKGAEFDAISLERRTAAAVATLSGHPVGVVTRIPRVEFKRLTAICDALGFFD